MVCFLEIFKGCLPQILLGLFLNTLTPVFLQKLISFSHFNRLMDQYTEIFKRLKGGNRTLNWYLSVGSVELDVELEDSLKTFHVTPAQATLLLQFQERGKIEDA